MPCWDKVELPPLTDNTLLTPSLMPVGIVTVLCANCIFMAGHHISSKELVFREN